MVAYTKDTSENCCLDFQPFCFVFRSTRNIRITLPIRIILWQEKVGLGSSAAPGETGKGKSKISKNVTHGYHTAEGKSSHPMEDYVFAEFKQVGENELGLFAIFDGHLSQEVPDYLRSNLFNNILNEVIAVCFFGLTILDYIFETKDLSISC